MNYVLFTLCAVEYKLTNFIVHTYAKDGDMGEFNQIYKLVEAPLNDFANFMQMVAIGVATAMATYNKVMEMTAGMQEDQMYSQKTKKVFIALVFVFLIPTFFNILKAYFYNK